MTHDEQVSRRVEPHAGNLHFNENAAGIFRKSNVVGVKNMFSENFNENPKASLPDKPQFCADHQFAANKIELNRRVKIVNLKIVKSEQLCTWGPEFVLRCETVWKNELERTRRYLNGWIRDY